MDAANFVQSLVKQALSPVTEAILYGGAPAAALGAGALAYGAATAPKGRRLHGATSTLQQTQTTTGGAGLGAILGGLGTAGAAAAAGYGPDAGLPMAAGGALLGAGVGGYAGNRFGASAYPGPRQLGLGDVEKEPQTKTASFVQSLLKQSGLFTRQLATPAALRFTGGKGQPEPTVAQTHEPTWLGSRMGYRDPNEAILAAMLDTQDPNAYAQNGVAGEMLADVHPEYFRPLRHRILSTSTRDGLNRDEEAIGKRLAHSQAGQPSQAFRDEAEPDEAEPQTKAASFVQSLLKQANALPYALGGAAAGGLAGAVMGGGGDDPEESRKQKLIAALMGAGAGAAGGYGMHGLMGMAQRGDIGLPTIADHDPSIHGDTGARLGQAPTASTVEPVATHSGGMQFDEKRDSGDSPAPPAPLNQQSDAALAELAAGVGSRGVFNGTANRVAAPSVASPLSTSARSTRQPVREAWPTREQRWRHELEDAAARGVAVNRTGPARTHTNYYPAAGALLPRLSGSPQPPTAP